MDNILVTGALGQLGSELQELAVAHKASFFFTDYKELDITNHDAVKDYIFEHKITAIINCAAYTAVDKAENEQEKAAAINHAAVKNFAQLSKAHAIKLIHISTDYVFDGTNFKPYAETDVPNPASVYGATKLEGEQALLEIAPYNAAIIRTSWVYSSFGANFVKTMLRLAQERTELGVICDQVGTPTYAKHLAMAILEVLPNLENTTPEILHYSNEGACSWYDFAYEIFELGGLNVKLNAITTQEYPTAAKRPYYSILSKQKIKEKYKVSVPHWKIGLQACLTKLQNY